MNITEFAAYAGVSKAAVSRFFNGGYLSAEKKAAIAKAVEETGYRPSMQAQMMRTRRTKQIGVILPKLSSESCARMVEGISRVLDEQGYQLLLVNTANDNTREVRAMDMLRHDAVDGIILIASIFTPEHEAVLESLKIPVVILGQQHPGYSCVYHDDFGAARAATARMLEKGRRLPGFLGATMLDKAVGQARRAGYEWFLTQKISWNDTTKFPHHSFMWEGIDGTRILTHFPPSDTYCSSMSMRELMYSQRNFLDKDLSRNAILLYGFGDGGGGPTREMTARIRRDHDLAGAPKIDFGTPDQLFDRVRKDIVDDARGETPVFHGELYLELHRGTLTAQQDMKRGCRQEESMLRVVEYLCAVASIKNPGYVYPREELDRIWKTLLLNQFHDILPGSAIAWVHRQAREEYARDIARLRDIAAAAGQAVKEAEPGIATVKDAVIAPYASNPQYSWAVRDGGGTAVEESVIPVSVERDGNAIILDNGRLRVRIEADGTVSSLIDLALRRELVPSGVRMGRYELLKDEPFHWDAWDIQRDAFLAADTLTDAMVEHVEDMPDGSAAIHVVTRARGVEIHTVITLRPGSGSLDFTADVDWHAVEKFLKVDMPVTVQAVNAQYECQYGLVERPINKNTRSDDAKFESCTHRFVRIADADYAAAVVNASTYGSDVSPIHAAAAHGAGRGTMVRLSLLSAPLYPDPRTDQGEHFFAWSLVAGAGMESVLAEASRLNAPIMGELPAVRPLATLTDVAGTPVLDWVKLADDGSGDLIVRLYEAAGGDAKATLRLDDTFAGCTVEEVNLMEEPVLADDLPRALVAGGPVPAEGASVSFTPFQIVTLRIRR